MKLSAVPRRRPRATRPPVHPALWGEECEPVPKGQVDRPALGRGGVAVHLRRIIRKSAWFTVIAAQLNKCGTTGDFNSEMQAMFSRAGDYIRTRGVAGLVPPSDRPTCGSVSNCLR